MENKTIRIALIGPESSGKSTLAAYISAKFNFVLVSEYAREYIGALDRPYIQSDVRRIYEKQLALEMEHLLVFPKGLVSDTECINGLVWCEEAFGSAPSWFENQIQSKPYDLYLLTTPDIPYEADPLRENPGRGMYFFNRFQKELEKRGLTFVVISGDGETRLRLVEKTIQELITDGRLQRS
jgi:NadR type nicotinamide-nucleotide adenylyltransferase